MDERERLVYQRNMLNKKLGLDMAGSLKLDLDTDLYTDEDLLTGMETNPDCKPDLVSAILACNLFCYT